MDSGPDERIPFTGQGIEGGEDTARRNRLAERMVVSPQGMELHQAHNGPAVCNTGRRRSRCRSRCSGSYKPVPLSERNCKAQTGHFQE